MTNEQIWGDDSPAKKIVSRLARLAGRVDESPDELDTLHPFAPLEPTAPLDTTAQPPLPNDPPMPPHQLTDGTNRLQCGHADCRGWLNRRYAERCPNCNRRVGKVEKMK
jgi:hypothetical protein